MKRKWQLLCFVMAALSTSAYAQDSAADAVRDASNPVSQDAAAPDSLDYVTARPMPRSDTKGPFYYKSENEMRMRKLCRGFANVGLCVAEVPNQMFQEAHRTSPVTGIIVGGVKGVGKGCERLGIGIWEVFTFYHAGANHYQPYVQPEVVMMEYMH